MLTPPPPPPAAPAADSGASSPGAAREIELKLHVHAGDLGRIAGLPALTALAAGPPVSHHLRTVYFDTPDLTLARDGVALRVRRENRHYVQALKTMAGESSADSAGVSVRREWEWPLGTETPDLGLLDADGAGGLIPEDVRGRLAPVFATDFRRTVLLLRPDSKTTVELAVDDGEIHAGNRSARISEVELELKGGRVGRLFELALLLQRFVPVRVGTENKAEVGYRLLTGYGSRPVVPPAPALSPVTTTAEAFRHILRHGLAQVLANEACVLSGGDPEGLHQIRVALRRLRLALRLFRTVIVADGVVELRREIAWLQQRLRAARAWDVVLTLVENAPAGLRAAVAEERQPAAEAAAHALSGNRASRLVLTLGAWMEEGHWNTAAAARERLDVPIQTLSGAWLAASFARARRGGAHLQDAGEAARRTLRRRIRRHASIVTFFRGLYPPAAVRAHLAALQPLHQALDRLDDAAQSRHLLRDLVDRHPACRAAVHDTVQRIAAATEDDRRALPQLWAGFRGAPAFWS